MCIYYVLLCAFYVQVDGEGDGRIASSELDVPASQPHLVIWGTNVVVSQCKEKFKNFLNSFSQPADTEQDELNQNESDTVPFYVQKLDEVRIFFTYLEFIDLYHITL